jgi:hypothetical protein
MYPERKLNKRYSLKEAQILTERWRVDLALGYRSPTPQAIFCKTVSRPEWPTKSALSSERSNRHA